MKRNWLGPIVMLTMVVLIMGMLRARFGGVAETPASFAAHTTLDAALTQASSSGKPVLALVTADWCGPCQTLKREALADDRVTAWIGAHAIPAYVDGTDSNTEPARRELSTLGIEAFPTLVLLDANGTEVSRITGVVPPDALLDWLDRTTP